MKTIEQMMERKKILGLTNEMLSDRSGLPLGTVQKVMAGITKAPRRNTLLKLEQALFGASEKDFPASPASIHSSHIPKDEYTNPWGPSGSFPDTLRESAPTYGTVKKLYTLKDYYALPPERRVELIDGVFYDMASPSLAHQAILGQLYLQFASCIEKHPECELFFAPSDVCLDMDDYTMVQPDLYMICNRKDNEKRRLNGAPDFVLEILSPSNQSHDLFRKLSKYRFAHVREYWIVDPEKQRVIVYVFDDNDIPAIYSFHDTIPVGISNGECSIDFEKVFQKTERYL